MPLLHRDTAVTRLSRCLILAPTNGVLVVAETTGGSDGGASDGSGGNGFGGGGASPFEMIIDIS